MNDNTNEVYEPKKFGLSGVSDWTPYLMTQRPFPKGDHSGIHFEIPANYIADEFYYYGKTLLRPFVWFFSTFGTVTGMKNVLLDYYIEAVDVFGNKQQTDIYHVYVANANKTEAIEK